MNVGRLHRLGRSVNFGPAAHGEMALRAPRPRGRAAPSMACQWGRWHRSVPQAHQPRENMPRLTNTESAQTRAEQPIGPTRDESAALPTKLFCQGSAEARCLTVTLSHGAWVGGACLVLQMVLLRLVVKGQGHTHICCHCCTPRAKLNEDDFLSSTTWGNQKAHPPNH